MPLAAGTRIGGYEILSLAGTGGMGEVYRARDARLGRDVAIKVLGPELVGNADAVARFEREARTASSLNHPHIVHIYDLGAIDGSTGPTRYIAMEYIDGDTLRARLRRGASWHEVAPILADVADALAAAHRAGIVHRDLKPDNIMVSADGYAKIVDFGLAKLVDRSTWLLSHAETRGGSSPTRQGAILGTSGYMSPEQAQGHTADQRSDIFSFGCILYEVLAGRAPFGRGSPIDSMHAVVHDEPPRIDGIDPSLDALTRRCLAKNPRDRVDSASEIATVLRRASAPGDPTVTVQHPVADRRRWLLPAAAAVIAAAVLAWLAWPPRPPATTVSAGAPRVEKITSRGDVYEPDISPDGRYLVYAAPRGNDLAIWLRDLSDQSERPLVTLAGQRVTLNTLDLSFTSAGDGILYSLAAVTDRSRRLLFRVPLVGGSPRLLRETAGSVGVGLVSPDGHYTAHYRADSNRLTITDLERGDERVVDLPGRPLTWSADGRRLLFATPADTGMILHTVGADGAGSRMLASLPHRGSRFRWSPNGAVVAYLEEVAPQTSRLFTVDLTTAAIRPLGDRKWQGAYNLQWLGDGAIALPLTPDNNILSFDEIWLVAYPGGQARKLSPDTRGYLDLRASEDGRTLISTEVERRADLMVAPRGGADGFSRVAGGTNMMMSVCWTADGKIVFSSSEAGSYDLFVADANGENRRQLTADREHDETSPTASPDHNYIVFVSNQSGAERLYRIDTDGSGLRPLTTPEPSGHDANPQFAPDGSAVVYLRWEAGGPTIWKVPIDGGAPVHLQGLHTPDARDPDTSAFSGSISPDGRSLAFLHATYDPASRQMSPMLVAIAGIADGRIQRTFPYRPYVSVSPDDRLQWSTDGRALYYLAPREGVSNVWRQPTDGAKGAFVTSFESDVRDFEFSAEGRVVVSRVIVTRDVARFTNLGR